MKSRLRFASALLVLAAIVDISVAPCVFASASGGPLLQAQPATLPVGTSIAIRSQEPINSDGADLTREYGATLDDALVVGDALVADVGTPALLRIVEVQQSGAVAGRAALVVKLVAVVINGQRINLETGAARIESGSQGAKTAKAGAVGGAIGGVIGGIFGGKKGAAAGAVGGAASGVALAASSGQKVNIPAEQRLTFTVARTTSLQPAAQTSSGHVAGGSATTAFPPPTASELVRTADGIRVQIERCELKSDNSVACALSVATLNKDIELTLGKDYDVDSSMVDSNGSKKAILSTRLGASTGRGARTTVVQGVIVRGEIVFERLDTPAERVARLDLGYGFSDDRTAGGGFVRQHLMTFRNIPIEPQAPVAAAASPSPSSSAPAAPPSSGSSPNAISAEGFTIRLDRCYRQATAAVFCKFFVTNQKADRQVYIASGSMVDSLGMQQAAVKVTLGNAGGNSTHVDAVYNLSIPGEIRFGGVTPDVQSIAKLTLALGTSNASNAGRDLHFEAVFRNVAMPAR